MVKKRTDLSCKVEGGGYHTKSWKTLLFESITHYNFNPYVKKSDLQSLCKTVVWNLLLQNAPPSSVTHKLNHACFFTKTGVEKTLALSAMLKCSNPPPMCLPSWTLRSHWSRPPP